MMSASVKHDQSTCYACKYNDDDSCAHCRADWRAPHDQECDLFQKCEFPPGCDQGTSCGKRLCNEHFAAVYALLGPVR